MKAGFSFCPNDTFLFFAWVHGLVGQDLPIEPFIADVETLNAKAFEKALPLTKLSFATLIQLEEHYQMLPVGAALGWQCGPKIIAKKPFSLEELTSKTIAIPGLHTTAHLLLNRLLPPPGAKFFCRYDEIADLIKSGEVDAGLIIHESRFTFLQEGFHEVIDLGELWHEKTGLPLPLGCLAVQKGIDAEKATKNLRDSLLFAYENPGLVMPYILKHSLVKDPHVVKAHIDLYVTKESLELSLEGKKAITLLKACRQFDDMS